MRQTISSPKLADIPLWRLLIHLDDAERMLGASSESARILAAEIQRRLRGTRSKKNQTGKAVTDAAR
jgi:hypothetical protein